jgi:hypothetical protein
MGRMIIMSYQKQRKGLLNNWSVQAENELLRHDGENARSNADQRLT